MTHGHTRRAPEDTHTSNVTDALALYDAAGRIDCLKVTLEVLPVPDDGMVPITVFQQIGVLAEIIGDVSAEIGRHLPTGQWPPSPTAKQTAEAFSRALDPLGQTVTELGRLQDELLGRLPHFAPSGAPEDRLSDEVIHGCLDTGIEALDYAAAHLREQAARLAPRVRPRAPADRPSPSAAIAPAHHPAAPATPAPSAAKAR
ncbi:hypothetical protein [Streptomyces sp. CA-111067]|uniref:hypothetical protein n=1 Tax=Streptomyces sp. CA-111067 TaxID=3240046 RepID=UPI003D96DDA5